MSSLFNLSRWSNDTFYTPHRIANDASRNMTNSRIGFQHLPRELRDQIYQYVIGDIRQLNVSSSSWFGFFSRHDPPRQLLQHVPRCLILNQQILDEVMQVCLHQVSGIKAFSPKDISTVFPPDKQLFNIRRLKFTVAQPFYSSNGRGTSSSAQDVASRCPRLQELTVEFPATDTTMNKFASDLVNVFENKNLIKLTLNYRNAPMKAWQPDDTLFRPLEAWFLRECEKRGRNIDLTIDLSPGQKLTGWEDGRAKKGCITYVYFWDTFG